MIIRVFDGGDGSTSGGRSERSRESGDLLPDDARERDGDGIVTCMLAVAIMYSVCVRAEVLCGNVIGVTEEAPDSPGVLCQACSGVETFQLPHPSCSRLASALWGSAIAAKALQSVRILEPPADDSRLLALGPLGLGCLAQPAEDKPNALLCCVVFCCCPSRPNARRSLAAQETETVTQLHQPSPR